jgi:hypothetical protein
MMLPCLIRIVYMHGNYDEALNKWVGDEQQVYFAWQLSV